MMDSEKPPAAPDAAQYLVVARRYRPQDFTDLIGQDQVSTALANAINTNRVGHAYLFTGARGVGKTSTARILGKCLNCENGPTTTPCGECDACQAISAGEDMDVIEIDGASNNGVDEIRHLRANVTTRPSRSRYKIYIIDEVHMLSKSAFNALLKTLEEPPEHVKFIFCTTDPEKIPITVISRCQRFDFVGIQTDSITGRLRHIVDTENVQVTEDALKLLARRAGGSMRDSQSLLEQLLSFGGESITVDDVHSLLGTADSGRIWQIVECIRSNKAAAALVELDAAITQGADPGQVIEQLTGCFRDIMARQVGCADEMLMHVSGDNLAQLTEIAGDISLENVLAAIQILDDAMLRMRQSTQSRLIAEAAIVRLCQLEQLEGLSSLVAQLRGGNTLADTKPATTTSAEKKTADVGNIRQRVDDGHENPGKRAANSPAVAAKTEQVPTGIPDGNASSGSSRVQTQSATINLTAENLPEIWKRVLENLDGLTHSHASRCQSPAISAPNRLVIRFPATYTSSKAYCERLAALDEIRSVVAQVVGIPVKIEIEAVPTNTAAHEVAAPKLSQNQLRKQVMTHPLVQTVAEMFDGAVVAVEPAKTPNVRRDED